MAGWIGLGFLVLLFIGIERLIAEFFVEKNSFLHIGPGGDIAKRRYCSNIYTMNEVDAFMDSLTPKEKRQLARWERNNPPPSIGRDWLRHPETDYE